MPPSAHYIDAKGAPIVIKADGLAAGKGVVVQPARKKHTRYDMMLGRQQEGSAGARV